MKNKGFTLIELLAVIVILAVIALIATPAVLNSIATARANAELESARNFSKASEFYCAQQLMLPTPVVVSQVLTANIATVGAKGTQPTASALNLDTSCRASGTVTFGTNVYTVTTAGAVTKN